MSDKILSAVDAYYTDKLQEFGPTAKGVDWKDRESQVLRFVQLHRLFEDAPDASVADIGCGYGEFLAFLRRRGHRGPYRGIDVSPAMIETAEARFRDDPEAGFVAGSLPPSPSDFAVASGIFNVRLDFPVEDWEQYIRDNLKTMDGAGRRGFAFNCLTSYSDPGYRRDDLYYGDPCYWFDLCKRGYSRNVSLIHDYDLYEFTVLVRK